MTFESDKSFLGGKKNNIKNFKMLARKALMSIPVRYGHVKAGKPRVHISPMEKVRKKKILFFFLKLFNTFFLLL